MRERRVRTQTHDRLDYSDPGPAQDGSSFGLPCEADPAKRGRCAAVSQWQVWKLRLLLPAVGLRSKLPVRRMRVPVADRFLASGELIFAGGRVVPSAAVVAAFRVESCVEYLQAGEWRRLPALQVLHSARRRLSFHGMHHVQILVLLALPGRVLHNLPHAATKAIELPD